MRVILATMGTLGDHLPLIGLGSSLASLGLPVTIACNEAMHPLAHRAGLTVSELGARLGHQEASATPSAWDHWKLQPQSVQWIPDWQALIRRQVQALVDLLRPEDLLIAGRNLPLVPLIAAATGCRWIELGLNCGAMIDYGALEAIHPTPPWKQDLNQLELELRQEWLAGRDRSFDHPPCLRLHAVPANFVPQRYPQLQAVPTGFWTYDDPAWSSWQPDPILQKLLEGERAPLVLAFSSQPLIEPITVLNQHLRVAELLERPLVVVRGWAFRNIRLQHPLLVMQEPMPFRPLFQAAAAVFIHAGMGTMAAALEAGCRIVAEPYGNDQFMNTAQLIRQGLGLGVSPKRFDPAAVAAVLRTRLEGPVTPACPADWFEGLDHAGALIQACLDRRRQDF
jgi:UDP:flavonoid glycosyltransferase YjiC (YdhE family)